MREDSALLKRAVAGDVSEEDIRRLREIYRLGSAEDDSGFRFDIALKAAQFGYFRWPSRIRKYFRGRRVLDVGCGHGTHSIGFVTLGASEYIGLDPGMRLNNDVVKDKIGARRADGTRPKVSFGWTPKEVSKAFPQISFFKDTFEELKSRENFKKFDVISMHTVTEHLLQIEDVFAGCAELLSDDGVLIYMHDNFYGWKGHHMAPKRVEDIDEGDPEQQKYVDWRHIHFEAPEGHYFRRALNKIRLDDLKKLTDKYFNLNEWYEKRDDFGRLTDEIRARLPEYSERELTTSMVYCLASKR